MASKSPAAPVVPPETPSTSPGAAIPHGANIVTIPMRVRMLPVPHLQSCAPSDNQNHVNLRTQTGTPYANCIANSDVVLGTIVHHRLLQRGRSVRGSSSTAAGSDVATRAMEDNLAAYLRTGSDTAAAAAAAAAAGPARLNAYLRAGPRKHLYHRPNQSVAAVVTCGGLCPGMNDVIRAITKTLVEVYGVREVKGVRGGWHGFYAPHCQPPLALTPDSVDQIQHKGGTVLGSARGGFDLDKILSALQAWGCNLVFVIGGDGTHRGAQALSERCIAEGLPISVAGIPKTIDNDIGLIDRSFGFESAVENATMAIKAAKTEAECAPNGIGIVKLMGRDSGFIAAHATISSGDVDLLLIPELPFVVDESDDNNFLAHLERVLASKGHAVVVLSEGAGLDYLMDEQRTSKTDAAGNQPKLPPVGVFVKDRVSKYFEAKGKPATVKYIDPSYMVRFRERVCVSLFVCVLLAYSLGVFCFCSLFSLTPHTLRLCSFHHPPPAPITFMLGRFGVCLPMHSTAGTRLCLGKTQYTGRLPGLHRSPRGYATTVSSTCPFQSFWPSARGQ